MEETVRNLLQSQGPPEQKKEETVNIMVYQVHHMSYSWLAIGQLVLLRFLYLCPFLPGDKYERTVRPQG